MLIQAPKGTKDILPEDVYLWQYLEKEFIEMANRFGYKEIRLPVFEYTELFLRGVGDTTDIVNKEMYTFDDKGGRSLTLRPEGTAGVVRSYIENGMASKPAPIKLAYNITAYRYENVAKGRYREFHQFGIEAFGAKGPSIDGEVISLIDSFLASLGIKNAKLLINSIGCSSCRKSYHEALVEYFNPFKEELCETCQERLKTNPMRILDCKERSCKPITKNAPSILDYLCETCFEHFDGLKEELKSLDIEFEVDDRIVRGLDYYTKTVFEFVSDSVGAQGTICGGGRYDDLISYFDAPSTPGIGFAMGVERLIMQLSAEKIELLNEDRPMLFIANIGDESNKYASKIVLDLRKEGIIANKDLMGKSLKAQMKYANKINSKYVIVLGDDEVQNGVCQLKNMDTKETKDIKIKDIKIELLGGNDG